MIDEQAKEWLNGNELSYTIWDKKYRHNQETFEEWLHRISNGYEPIIRLIREKKFLFGGRILASRGIKDRKVTYSNCYVITPPEDNLESIFECAKKLARTYSYGGEITALPPCIVICRKQTSEPINVGCMFNMLTVDTLNGNTVL